jgi:hypothetical protein
LPDQNEKADFFEKIERIPFFKANLKIVSEDLVNLFGVQLSRVRLRMRVAQLGEKSPKK